MTEFRQTARPETGPDRPPPPPGWEDLGWDADGRLPPPGGRIPDLSALVAVIEAARTMVPRELQDQFQALVREALLTLRVLIDWYLERLDGPSPEPPVEDIPID